MSPASTVVARLREASFEGARAGLMGLGRLRAGAAAAGLGALAAFAQAPWHVWPAALIAITGFVWLIDGASEKETRVSAGFWRGWCFGFGYFLAGLWWVANAFLVDPARFAAFMPIAVSALPAGLALFWGAAAAICARFQPADWRRIPFFAGVFSVAELLRGNILTGFPWNTMGTVWPAGGEVSQVASVIGVTGLTVLTLFAFAAPAALGGPDRRPLTRMGPPIIAFAVFAGLFAAGFGRLAGAVVTETPDVRLRIIQAQIDQREKWRPENREAVVARYLALTAQPGIEGRTHVMWPESALPLFLLEEPRTLEQIAEAMNGDRVLLAGTVRRDFTDPLRPTYHNALAALRFADGTPLLSAVYDKSKLVPWGEFLPFPELTRLIGLRTLVSLGSWYTHGPGPTTMTVPGAPPLSPQICYEVIFPGFTPHGARRPGWIATVSNDAWYGRTAGPRQHFHQARYRALEEGLPLARSAAGGVSAVVDPYGRVVAALPIDAEGVLDAGLPGPLPPTIYARFGESAAFLFTLLAFLIAFAGPNRSRKPLTIR